MLGLFKSDPYTDSELGTFTRSGGKWQGKITVPGIGEKPIALSGNRKQPDMEALRQAQQFASQYLALTPEIQTALFEEYLPYFEAHEAGDYLAGQPFPQVSNDPALWDRVRLVGISIESSRGGTTTEVAYETDWDEEHTLGVLIKDGRVTDVMAI